MKRTTPSSSPASRRPSHGMLRGARLPLLLGAACFLLGCASRQATYPSPDRAAQALVNALEADDDDALAKVFGPEAKDVIGSGDEVADRERRARFVRAYQEKHELQLQDGRVTVCVGPDNWPLPIPIIKDPEAGGWRFDTAAGLDEMLTRRIGQNELDVIEVCKAVVDAQAEYAAQDRDGDGVAEYAGRFISEPGTRNGLYWETSAGEPPSPLGPLVGEAVAEGYEAAATQEPRPYHGYCYRMLTSQGADAPGGARDYVVNGQMIGGFAVVAYPAEYGSSGIMTFMVGPDGVVYQKDLGEGTDRVAREMSSFDPGAGWTKVQASEFAKTAGR